MIAPLPYCLYPTTIVVIDDNQAFTKSLCLSLSNKNPTVAHHNPKAALDFLLQQPQAKTFLDYCLLQSTTALNNTPEVHIEIAKIYQEAFRRERFQQISIVIADYTMPGMNGVELARDLKDKNYKKIMLTGEADHNIAVQAFNEGIIDQFIMKGAPNMINVLEKSIWDMQYQYFQDLSLIVTKTLINTGFQVPSHLLDSGFGNFFCNFMLENKIVEFYVANKQGDFLLIDSKGKVSWLTVRETKAMQQLSKLALNEHDQEPSEESELIVNSIQSQQQIPFFYPEMEQPEIYEWQAYLHPSTQLQAATNTYYIAHIQDHQHQPQKFENIISFSITN